MIVTPLVLIVSIASRCYDLIIFSVISRGCFFLCFDFPNIMFLVSITFRHALVLDVEANCLIISTFDYLLFHINITKTPQIEPPKFFKPHSLLSSFLMSAE